jgi:hypothetical protein
MSNLRQPRAIPTHIEAAVSSEGKNGDSSAPSRLSPLRLSEENTLFNTEMVISRQVDRLYLRLLITGILAVAALAGADVNGIWAGQAPNPKGDPQDVAFKFQLNGNTLTGKLFGDEFDLPIEEGSISGDQIKFIVTSTNYYNGSKVKFAYTGTIQGDAIELSRERVIDPTKQDFAKKESGKRESSKQTIKIKRL